MLDVNVKMLFTLYSKSLIYYTKFENYLLSFLTFAGASCGDCRAWLVRRIHWMGGIENWDSFGWF